MKKISSFLLGISIIGISTISCTFAYTKEESDAYHWAYMYGITTQPTIEAANLDGNITRQAFSKMIVNYLQNVIWAKQNIAITCTFPDENKITSDLVPYTKKTCEYGIMWSNWSAFNPMNPLSKAHLWTVLSRIIWGDEYNVSWNDYYIYHLNALNQYGIMDNISNPQDYAKRWDVLIMLKRTYEKFGSNVNINSQQNSNANINSTSDSGENYSMELEYDEDDYLSSLYWNQRVIYTWNDWTKYHYDTNFLNSLKATAEKKWESDLVKYLEIEAEYLENWLNQIESLDLENLPEMLWIDEDDMDFENMTEKEIKDLTKKIKEWVNKIMKENKDRNNKYLNDLEKINKKINKDKFWLKEKYKETKSFIEASNGFLDLYTEIIFKLVELAATAAAEDAEMDDGEAMGITFWLLWAALSYQGVAEEYQNYLEKWAINTIEALGWELNTNSTNNNTWKKTNSENTNNSNKNNNSKSNWTMVCTLNKSDSFWANIKSVYTVTYSGEIVNLVNTIETVNSDEEQWIEYYKNIVEETYKPYKNLKYYVYDIKTTKDTLTSKVTINYEKIDMNKFLEINPNAASLFLTKDNKVSLEKLKMYYELIGATCEQ